MDRIRLDGVYSQGYGIVPKLVMRDKNLHVIAKSIYAYMCSFAGKGEDVFPSQKLICYDLDIGRTTLNKYMKQLVDLGYVVIIKNYKSGKFANNIYRIKN